VKKPGAVLAFSLACAALSVAQSPSPARLLQEAIHLMETKGDYPAALRVFEQIAKGSDRNLAARSLLYAGSCYEKLGKSEAKNAYERLIRDFADQTDLVAVARTRLTALASPENAMSPSGMSAHRVLVDFPAFGALSPDGQRLTFPDWDTAGGNLVVLDLESKKKRRLTGTSSPPDPTGEAYGSIHSPDGKEIAYVWWNQRVIELRVVGLDGTASRVLYRNPDLHHMDVESWASDGRILCTLHLRTGNSQIALVSAKSGAAQVLKSFEGAGSNGATLSPDGRFVAYGLNGEIYLLAVRGSHEVALVENPAHDFNPVWSPEGDRILFSSDRTGSLGLWVLSVVDGNPRGTPKLLRPDMGKTSPVRFVRGDSLYYSLQTAMQDVYVAELDPETGKVTVPPSQASRRLVGSNSWPEWSRDGKFLAFVSGGLWGGRTLSILSLETGKQEELAPRMTFISHLRWSPDGGSILVSGRDEGGRGGVYKIEAQTGDVRPIVQSGSLRYSWDCAWSPDGRTVYYEFGKGIKARDLATGQERDIRSEGHHFAPSPDGRSLAVGREDPSTKGGVLEIVALETGEVRELLRVADPSVFYKALTWSADGRFLFFGKRELWRVAAETGALEKIAITMAPLLEVRVHPDGRRIAFSAFENGAELWVMERFLPGPKTPEIATER
jgi:Tol biopolymer transport system component